MPKAFPEEFRRDVIAVAREGEAPLRQIAKDFGISEGCLHRWLKIADREDGVVRDGRQNPGDESAELRELKKRNRLLEQENDVLRRAAASYGGRPVNDGMVKRWHAPSCVPPLPVAGMVIDASGR